MLRTATLPFRRTNFLSAYGARRSTMRFTRACRRSSQDQGAALGRPPGRASSSQAGARLRAEAPREGRRCAAKPAYIFTEHGVGYRMPRPGSAGLRTPFRERRRRAPDARPLPRSEPRPASRRGRGAGIVPDKVGGDAIRNPHRRIAHRSLRQMRIARGRLDLRVTEQAPDHRQALPERQRP